ncbi:MAG: hypothetical protein K0Q49_741, partial [Haloplasmataceae bacterium]|nr:hypothetical protein [Haloplasmataceae bacterium]
MKLNKKQEKKVKHNNKEDKSNHNKIISKIKNITKTCISKSISFFTFENLKKVFHNIKNRIFRFIKF